jgi:hypothetical protein
MIRQDRRGVHYEGHFCGPSKNSGGWRFVFFVFLLFGFSKLFFWSLTVLFHYQEHAGWWPTDFLLDGALSFAAALLALIIHDFAGEKRKGALKD